jgi:hypothetical protein
MEPEQTSRFHSEEPVPLRGTVPMKGALEGQAESTEEPVPLRPTLERAEAEERAERLRLVTGRRSRSSRWSRRR